VDLPELIQHLLSFLLENVVFSSQLIDSLFNFVELVGQFTHLTSGNSEFLLCITVLVSQSLVLVVEAIQFVCVVPIIVT
jgi:hypothetical protein